jgi:transposase-like protein
MSRFVPGYKAQEWLRRMRRFRKSGHSVVEFCRQEGVSAPSFYFWRKRLVQTVGSKPSNSEVPSGFRPVRVLPTAGVSVQLPGGTQFVVPTSDAESLRLVIDLLAHADAERLGDTRPC